VREYDAGNSPEETDTDRQRLDRDVVQPDSTEPGARQDIFEPGGVDVVDCSRSHASTVALYDAGVFLVVLLFIILVPVAELIVVFKVAGALGWLETLSALLLFSVVGAWLVRRQGISLLMRIQAELSEGRVPTKSVVDGLLLLVAGALLLTPGFITDAVGVILLFPPTRIAVRSLLIRRYQSRVDVYKTAATRGGTMWTRVVRREEVIDTEGRENRPRRDSSGEIGP